MAIPCKREKAPPSGLSALRDIWLLLGRIEGKTFRLFFLPVLLLAFATACEILGMGLLTPLVQILVDSGKPTPVHPRLFNVFPMEVGWAPFPGHPLVFLVALIFFVETLKNIAQYAGKVLLDRRIRSFVNRLRKAIFRRCLGFGKAFIDCESTANFQGILIQFTSDIGGCLPNLQWLLLAGSLLLAYCAVLFLLLPKLMLLILVVAPLFFLLSQRIIDAIQASSRRLAERTRALNRKVLDALLCIPLIKAYAMEQKEEAGFNRLSDEIETIESEIDRKDSLVTPVQETLKLCAYVFLVLFASIGIPSTKVSSLLVFLLALKLALSNLGSLNHSLAQLARIAGHVPYILDLLKDQGKIYVPSGTLVFRGLRRGVEFRNVTFGYRPGSPVLRNLSFFVEAGLRTALVGPTGAGKTTVISLLQRFYDCEPEGIFVDGTDIREYSIESLRALTSVVTQDIHLFHDSLRKNLVYGFSQAPSEEEIRSVLRRARLEDFVDSLPQKLDTVIGDRGARLSGGEKQRLSIARALLRGSDILILDEATSGVDTVTENAIQQAIEEVTRGKTTLIVAHRLSTIRNADKVVVIDRGALVEEGPFETLLRKRGAFFKSWIEQSGISSLAG